MGEADHGGLDDAVDRVDHQLDLLGIDVEAAGYDQVLGRFRLDGRRLLGKILPSRNDVVIPGRHTHLSSPALGLLNLLAA